MAQASKIKEQVTCDAMLLPVGIMAVVLVIFFAFQLSLVLKDSESLHQAAGNQAQAFRQSEQILAQFAGLVQGTKDLSEQGNKTVAPIAERMRQLGILPPLPKAGEPAKPPVPVKDEVAKGPVKP